VTVPWVRPRLARVLGRARHRLLDFDGPVCDLYAAVGADVAADRLRRTLRATRLPFAALIDSENDPLRLLPYAASHGREVLDRVAERLTTAELDAALLVPPTPGLQELLARCRAAGRRVGVVGDQAVGAIEAYLAAHQLVPDAVVGRTDADPARLMPRPYLVERAVTELGVHVTECVLVSDAVPAVVAAQRAGMLTIGYAHEHGRRSFGLPPRGEPTELASAGAEAVVSTLDELVAALG
jgi:phosphoglycolate phosphatase